MKQKYKIILSLFLILFLYPILSLAEENLILPEYTEEYKKWLTLSEEEKQEYIEPPAYESNVESVEELIQESSSDINTNVSISNLPAYYQRKYYGVVKDQGSSNACWAYSAANMFDTNYYLMNNLNKKLFSNLHMDYITSYQYNKNGFNRRVDSGGNVQIALAYATNGMGISLESAIPDKNQLTVDSVCNTPIVAKVNDYVKIAGEKQLKDYIYRYGVISIYTYISGSTYFSSSSLYNNKNLAYCCTNIDRGANHAVTLIGWDDNYTNSSFPGRKGAYIALNSYGTSFGNNGLYFIFYDDAFAKQSTTYGATNTTDINYDYLYQHDPYGYTAEAGYGTGTFAANVFKRQNAKYSEKLTEVSSYFPQAGNVTIYINANGNDVKTTSATDVMNTFIQEAGYHTIKLDREIILKNSEFSIGIRYPGVMSVELPTSVGWCSTVTSKAGESYISSNGIHYSDMKQFFNTNLNYQHANACIKAFTKKGSAIVQEYCGDLGNYVFDYQYYADHNPDLYIAFGYNEAELINHWNTYGIREGRASSSILNLAHYVSQNHDLLKAFGHDYGAIYNHFLNYGYSEYRESSPEYDGKFYRNYNNDLKNMTSMELIRHYSIYGKNELRIANTTPDIIRYLFDSEVYAELNPDVARAFGNQESLLKKHWYEYGIAEGRRASYFFDARYYLAYNKDIANTYSPTDYKKAYEHFIYHGFMEGRQGSCIFSISYYLANSNDLLHVFGQDYLKGMNHFVSFGKRETRVTSPQFNVEAYRAKNFDLKQAFTTSYTQYFIHYLKHGQYENRIAL